MAPQPDTWKLPALVTRPAGCALAADRSRRHDTGWRELPVGLLETPCRGEWSVETRDTRLALRPGEVLFVAPGTTHRLQSAGGPGMTSTWILLSWERNAVPLRFPPGCLVLRDTSLAKFADEMAAILTAEPSLADQARFHSLALGLLAAIAGRLPVEDRSDPRIERAVAFLSENLATPVTRSRLATVAGLSESRLHDVFKEVMGEAPMAYLNRRRIQQAAFLLARSSQPVADIGDACGFPSPQYFSRFFHNKTGLSPSAFRRQFQ